MNKLSIAIETIRCLSLRKFFQIVKLYVGFFLSEWFKKPVFVAMPMSVAIEPTTSCNLRCPECPSGLRSFTRPTGMLSQENFEKWIDTIYRDLLHLTFYFQGEPYLHKQFLDMVSYAHSKKILTSTSTNAHYLDDVLARKTVESGLTRIIISIDGTTQDTYQQYRVGGDIQKVMEGAKNVVKWKKNLNKKLPYVVFQFLVVKPNEHQIEEAKELARQIGVDEISFKTAQIYDYKKGSNLIPTIDYYSRYSRQNDGSYVIKNKLLNRCWKMWHSCVITWDGKVVPCCFDKDATHVLGDLSQRNFYDIWYGNAYRVFRQQILSSRKSIDICTNCSEGLKVWA